MACYPTAPVHYPILCGPLIYKLFKVFLSNPLYFFALSTGLIWTPLFQPPNQKKRYQIHLKSHTGPIFVLLVNKDDQSSAPVVVQVPPPPEDNLSLENQNQPPLDVQNIKTEVGRNLCAAVNLWRVICKIWNVLNT